VFRLCFVVVAGLHFLSPPLKAASFSRVTTEEPACGRERSKAQWQRRQVMLGTLLGERSERRRRVFQEIALETIEAVLGVSGDDCSRKKTNENETAQN